MQDLARLGILLRNHVNRLRGCQVTQHPLGQTRIQPETLQRSDDPVAPERRVEPRHPGIGVQPRGQRGRHHVQVGGGALDQCVELPVPRLNRAELPDLSLQLRPGFRSRAFENQQPRAGRFALASGGDVEQDRLSWPQGDVEGGMPGVQGLRPRGELEHRAPHNPVETAIPELHLPVGQFGLQILPARLPLEPPHLVDVREVGRELDAQGRIHRLHPMVLDAQLLVQGAHPEELPPCQVQRAHRQIHLAPAA